MSSKLPLRIGTIFIPVLKILVPEFLNIINSITKDIYLSSKKFNCSFVYSDQQQIIANLNSSGFYPEDHYLGQIQRNLIDVQVTPTRIDSIENPLYINMESVVFDSKAIIVSASKAPDERKVTILLGIIPFQFLFYFYLLLICILLAIIFSLSFRFKINRSSQRRTQTLFKTEPLHSKLLKSFKSCIITLIDFVFMFQLKCTISDSSPTNCRQIILWIVLLFSVFVVNDGYLGGLYSTELSIKEQEARVESLEDILDPKFHARPFVSAHMYAFQDFVNAKPGSVEYKVFEMMKQNYTDLIEEKREINPKGNFDPLLYISKVCIHCI